MSPALFSEMEKTIGPADIFVYDVGIGNLRGARTQRESLEAGIRLQDNVTRAQTVAGAVQESMSRRASGRMIYLAPWAWDRYSDSMSYETAKGAVIAITHACAREMARYRINVNCIVPGFIRTIRPSKIQSELADRLNSEIPAGRMGEISDITDTVLFLAGDSSKYLTGQILRCTGGAD